MNQEAINNYNKIIKAIKYTHESIFTIDQIVSFIDSAITALNSIPPFTNYGIEAAYFIEIWQEYSEACPLR